MKSWSPGIALLALAIGGQAAALSLFEAPHYAVYQHYRPFSQLFLPANSVALATLATQATVCVLLAIRARADLLSAVRNAVPRWWLLSCLGILAFAAAVPTQSVGRFGGEVAASVAVMVLAGTNLILAVRAIPDSGLERIAAFVARRLSVEESPSRRRWDTRIPRLAALWVALAASLLAYFVWEAVPHIDDSIAYLFQAKYMSLGKLWLPRPDDPESFGVAHLLVDGDRWYGKFFPGWPSVLAIGVLAGAPWLVSPLLGAASILLAHRFLTRNYGVRVAHGGVLLLAVSPWFLFMSASFMAHAVALFLLLLSVVAIDALRDRDSWVLALLAGASLGMLFLTRPFDAALVGPVVGLWALGVGGTRLRVTNLFAIGVSAALVASLYFVYNGLLTGDVLTAPHRLWSDRVFGIGVDRFGFGRDIGPSLWSNMDPLPGHGLADVILNANKNLSSVNFELFGWGCGSLVLALIGFQPGVLRRKDALVLRPVKE